MKFVIGKLICIEDKEYNLFGFTLTGCVKHSILSNKNVAGTDSTVAGTGPTIDGTAQLS